MSEVPFHMLDENTQKYKKMELYAELSIKRSGISLTKIIILIQIMKR